jgi:hypothetical protein
MHQNYKNYTGIHTYISCDPYEQYTSSLGEFCRELQSNHVDITTRMFVELSHFTFPNNFYKLLNVEVNTFL